MSKAPSVSRPWFWWVVIGLIMIIVALIIWWANHQTDWVFWTILIIGIVLVLIGAIWWMMELYPSKSMFHHGADMSGEHYEAYLDGERIHQDDTLVTRSGCIKPGARPPPRSPVGDQRTVDRALEERQAAQRRALDRRQSSQRGAYRGPSDNPALTQAQDIAFESKQAAERQALEQLQAAVRAGAPYGTGPAVMAPAVMAQIGRAHV